jgi:hypothetical protein
VPNSHDERPPTRSADGPSDAHWSAGRRLTAEDESADHSVRGPVIRFMWDYGVRIPLWDAEGLLPEEPGWLKATLGLSDPLIDDLTRWGREMEALDAAPRRRTPIAYEALDARARVLVERLQRELGSRFTVRYQRW